MAFPRKPVLDRVFVQVTPIEEIFEQSDVEIPLESSHIKTRSDRGVVVAVGRGAEGEVKEGDTVFFDEMAYAGHFYLMPSDKYRKDLPMYLEIRVGDLRGVSA